MSSVAEVARRFPRFLDHEFRGLEITRGRSGRSGFPHHFFAVNRRRIHAGSRRECRRRESASQYRWRERWRTIRPRRAPADRRIRARLAGRPRPHRGPEFSLALSQQPLFHVRPLAEFRLAFRDPLGAGGKHFAVPGWGGHTLGRPAEIVPKFFHDAQFGGLSHFTQGQSGRCRVHDW